MKNKFCFLLVVIMLLSMGEICVYADSVNQMRICGSWYGQYTGWYGSEDNLVQRYMNMTITECDENGNFPGNAYIITVEGQEYANGNFAPKNMTDEQKASNYAAATREQAVVLALRIYNASDNF